MSDTTARRPQALTDMDTGALCETWEVPNRRPREGWRFGLPWVRMKRAALASVALVVVGVALVFVSPGAGIAFACLGFVGLFLAVFIGVLTAAADQPNPTRKNFGGRYT